MCCMHVVQAPPVHIPAHAHLLQALTHDSSYFLADLLRKGWHAERLASATVATAVQLQRAQGGLPFLSCGREGLQRFSMLQSCWRLACASYRVRRALFLGGRAIAEAAGQHIDRVRTKSKRSSTRAMCVVRVEAQGLHAHNTHDPVANTEVNAKI